VAAFITLEGGKKGGGGRGKGVAWSAPGGLEKGKNRPSLRRREEEGKERESDSHEEKGGREGNSCLRPALKKRLKRKAEKVLCQLHLYFCRPRFSFRYFKLWGGEKEEGGAPRPTAKGKQITKLRS